jgi:hypothetical protein
VGKECNICFAVKLAGGQLRDMAALRAVFVAREGRLLGALAAKMRGVSGEAVFDTWMKRESDLVQATAQAYAEREVLDACIRAIQQVHPIPWRPPFSAFPTLVNDRLILFALPYCCSVVWNGNLC